MKKIALIGLLTAVGMSATTASTPVLINFETVPTMAQGPSLFDSAGNEKDVVVAGVATISGGVVLGDATNFPAQSFATSPNVYASANGVSGITDNATRLPTLTISIDPSYVADEVSFPLFNGLTTGAAYTATAFNGNTVVDTMTFLAIPANTASGFTTVDLKGNGITSVSISPNVTSSYDFAIDTLGVNELFSDVITPGGLATSTGTPEPGSALLLSTGLIIGALSLVKRTRSKRDSLPTQKRHPLPDAACNWN